MFRNILDKVEVKEEVSVDDVHGFVSNRYSLHSVTRGRFWTKQVIRFMKIVINS